MLSRHILVGASAIALALGVAGAQAAPKKHKQQPTSHSQASLACSQQANEKGLHGKARKKFREACKRQFTRGYGYAPKQATDFQPQQGQAYKPAQDQGFKAKPQQGQGGNNPMKWW